MMRRISSKIDVRKEVWANSEHHSARPLAEHFSDALIFNRLEIVTIVLKALASRHHSQAPEWCL